MVWPNRVAKPNGQRSRWRIPWEHHRYADGSARGPTLSSFPAVGEVTCTLGEIRQRSDFIVLWGADPAATLPRFLERYVSGEQPPKCVFVGSEFPFIGEFRSLPSTDQAR